MKRLKGSEKPNRMLLGPQTEAERIIATNERRNFSIYSSVLNARSRETKRPLEDCARRVSARGRMLCSPPYCSKWGNSANLFGSQPPVRAREPLLASPRDLCHCRTMLSRQCVNKWLCTTRDRSIVDMSTGRPAAEPNSSKQPDVFSR